jgi:hypothetical protein
MENSIYESFIGQFVFVHYKKSPEGEIHCGKLMVARKDSLELIPSMHLRLYARQSDGTLGYNAVELKEKVDANNHGIVDVANVNSLTKVTESVLESLREVKRLLDEKK